MDDPSQARCLSALSGNELVRALAACKTHKQANYLQPMIDILSYHSYDSWISPVMCHPYGSSSPAKSDQPNHAKDEENQTCN